MRLTFKLFLLELKRIIAFLPRLLGTVLILLALTSGALLCHKTTDTAPDNRVKIGYFNPDEDVYVAMLINMVAEMDSVKSICTFVPAESEQAVYSGIEQGDFYGGIVFPKDYINGIMQDKNTPARVIVPQNSSNPVFKQLVSTGSDMLVSVQAGIYSANGNKQLTSKQIMGINLEYINFVLGRSDLFVEEEWSAYGSLSAVQYYCATGLGMLILLIGVGLAFLFENYGSGFWSYCRLWGYNAAFMLALKQLLVFVILLFVLIPVLVVLNSYIPFITVDVMNILIAVFVASQFITCFYSVTGGGASVPFTAAVLVSGFFSGCFVPLVYLTDSGMDKLCSFMPPYHITQCFFSLYSYQETAVNALSVVAGIYAVTACLMLVRGRLVR